MIKPIKTNSLPVVIKANAWWIFTWGGHCSKAGVYMRLYLWSDFSLTNSSCTQTGECRLQSRTLLKHLEDALGEQVLSEREFPVIPLNVQEIKI